MEEDGSQQKGQGDQPREANASTVTRVGFCTPRGIICAVEQVNGPSGPAYHDELIIYLVSGASGIAPSPLKSTSRLAWAKTGPDEVPQCRGKAPCTTNRTASPEPCVCPHGLPWLRSQDTFTYSVPGRVQGKEGDLKYMHAKTRDGRVPLVGISLPGGGAR